MVKGNQDMAVCQNQWYQFGVGTPPISVYFSGDWDVHWGYGLLTHGHMCLEYQRDIGTLGIHAVQP